MSDGEYVDKASYYLTTLCNVEPNRRTGALGNRETTEFSANIVKVLGYQVDNRPFPCLDFISSKASLEAGGDAFEISISLYSLGCDRSVELLSVSSAEELESCDPQGKILLMRGAICAEQLMPKSFVFYNPDHQKRIYALLEEKKPATDSS